MTREPDPSVEGDKAKEAEDAELGRVLEAYLADLEAGLPADRERLLAAHPAIARELRACLQVMNLAERMVDASGSGSRARRPVPRLDSTIVPQGQSVLTSLSSGSGPAPRVHLRDLPDEPEPVVKPRSAEMPVHNGASLGRYQLQGEIARGGMGAILKGRDVDLGRDLALKVLLESHQGNPEVVSRFIEEAQIGGQLQHPGIAPVYELGTFPEPDRRPYFAMKLVKGQTLAALLQERTNPAHDLPRFLAIFEAICQTVAYAHARGVIHRDLKPSNVMVGSFGEVQVMDWGLAKVLPRGGIADEAGAPPVQETVIMTVRSGSAGSGSESQAGSVLGTPAYMAPEQARGEAERIDERADVFGLGAILCEVLTGRPPFVGSTREEIRAQAARGDLADAVRRLDACAAEAELIGLARSCLTAERDGRARNAGEVARRVTAYLAGVQERLRAAELARVEALTRAAEERKRRRLTVALAASMLIAASVAGGGWAYVSQQRAARLVATTRVVSDALSDAERLRGQARSAAPSDLAVWFQAVSAAKHARDLLAEGEPDRALQQRVDATLTGVEQEQAAAERQVAEIARDRKLLAELEAIRGNRSEHWDSKRTEKDYALAFRAFGIDLDQLDPNEAGKRIAQRSQPVELASYLDDWAFQRQNAQDKKDETSWRRLLAAAKAADPDPWRVALRDQIGRNDHEALRRLASDEEELQAQSPPSLVLLATALIGRGDREPAERVLRRAWRIKPDDFWVNFNLPQLRRLSWLHDKPEEAVRYLSVAVAIRPRSFSAHNNLGTALTEQGKRDEAIAEYREALRIKPDFAEAHTNLGGALAFEGKLDDAIAEYRESLRLKPNFSESHYNLGIVLQSQGKLDEAIAAYRTALSLKPDFAEAHTNLGSALRDQGKLNDAVAACRVALRHKPELPEAHNNLGIALAYQGKLGEAIAEFRTVLRLKPDLRGAHSNLGKALRDLGKLEEAIVECREELRLRPDFSEAHTNLGDALWDLGKLEGAIAEYREALRLKPGSVEAHFSLGGALRDLGKLEEAIVECREALRLKPDLGEAHCRLGHVFRDQGRFVEALAEFKRGHELGSKNPNWPYPSAELIRQTERLVELDRKLPAILAGNAKPVDAAETLSFAQLCHDKKLHAASARLWSEAFQAQPKLADDMQVQHRYNAACAAALVGSGQGKDDPPPDDAAKTRWRKQAIDWLKADLKAWSKSLESAPPQARQFILQTLQHWKADPDLAGLRDPAAVAKLPEEEQKACQALWVEVDLLSAKSQGTNPGQGR